jgi:tetratricopeptide (TPR) repeat protein
MIAADAPGRRLALGHALVANAARVVGNYDEARTHALSALQLFEGLGDRYFVGYGHLLCGVTELSAGEVEAARAYLLESFRAYEETGAKADAALALSNLGECAYATGEIDLAETIVDDAADRCLQAGNRYFLAYANHGRARIFVARQRWDAAIRVLLGVTRSAQEFGDPELIALCAELGAEVMRPAKRYTAAAMLQGAADAERERAGASRLHIYRADYDRLREAIEVKLGNGPAEHARSIGAAFASGDLPGRIEASLREAARILAPRTRARAPYIASIEVGGVQAP